MVGKGDDLGVLSGGFKHYARELEQERRAPCCAIPFCGQCLIGANFLQDNDPTGQ